MVRLVHFHALCIPGLVCRLKERAMRGVTASDLMTTSVITLTAGMTLLDMDTVLFKRGVSGAPVVENQRLVGVASQADIVRTLWEGQHEVFQRASFYATYPVPVSALEYISKDGPDFGNRLVETTVGEVMTRDPLVAHPDDSIEELADRLVRDQIHRLPVTDPGTGHLVGIVSSLDLVNAINRFGLKTVA